MAKFKCTFYTKGTHQPITEMVEFCTQSGAYIYAYKRAKNDPTLETQFSICAM